MSILEQLKKHLHNKKVLLVDDDKLYVEILEEILTPFFKEIVVSHDGAQALDIIDNSHFDLIITDLDMPLKNGIDLARAIKQKNSRTLILISSSHDNQKNLFDLINIGVDGFLKKPIFLPELHQTLLKTFLK